MAVQGSAFFLATRLKGLLDIAMVAQWLKSLAMYVALHLGPAALLFR
jgi:hypothetical protein